MNKNVITFDLMNDRLIQSTVTQKVINRKYDVMQTNVNFHFSLGLLVW